MNPIRKATALVIALTITVTGATLATAPMALAGSQSVTLTQEKSVASAVTMLEEAKPFMHLLPK
ncbi:MAG: hypothetical protein WAU49_17740 [Steroidobacteraceae bacterium]